MTKEQAPATRPPRYKQAVITWLDVYRARTLTLAALGPTMESWPLPLRILLMRMFRGWMLRSN